MVVAVVLVYIPLISFGSVSERMCERERADMCMCAPV